jgi:hypothetical protein
MAKVTEKQKGLADRLRPTGMNHIFHFDVNGDDRFREVAVVKMVKDAAGTVVEVRYIDVVLLDTTDKGRLKGIVTGVHANKYELWELLDQTQLNNGLNGLTYFHQLVKVVQGPGASNTSMGTGLANVPVQSNQMIGHEFTDPKSAVLDK